MTLFHCRKLALKREAISWVANEARRTGRGRTEWDFIDESSFAQRMGLGGLGPVCQRESTRCALNKSSNSKKVIHKIVLMPLQFTLVLYLQNC